MGQEPRKSRKSRRLDPRDHTLDEWLRLRGTRTGTFTINEVTYTDLGEVEWRRANDEWLSKAAA